MVLRERGSIGPWWALAPIGGLVTVCLLLTHAPLHARFSLAEDDLSDTARSVIATEDPAAAAKALGD